MPLYAYQCELCGWDAVLRRTVEERVMTCPSCHGPEPLRPLITKEHHPHTLSASVSNHQFNHGQGQYDMGLGRMIYSREHRRSVMEELGVVEWSGHPDDVFADPPDPPPVPVETIKDLWEHAEAEFDKGKRPQATVPDQTWVGLPDVPPSVDPQKLKPVGEVL